MWTLSSVPLVSGLEEFCCRQSSDLSNVLHTFPDVGSPLALLCAVGLDENGGVSIESQFNHLTADVGQVGQVPQQVQDLHHMIIM